MSPLLVRICVALYDAALSLALLFHSDESGAGQQLYNAIPVDARPWRISILLSHDLPSIKN